MENQNILIMCRKCGRKSPVSQMRYDSNGKDLICINCLGQRKIESPSIGKSVKKEGGETMKYFCPNCKYRFSRKKEVGFPGVCPFCGKSGVDKDSATSADSLLKESDKFKDI